MFGQPQQPAPKDWADMYFYQKLQHVVDSTAEAVFARSSWWLPAIAVSMAGSLFIFSQGDILPQATMLLSSIALPHPAAPAFGQRMNAEAMGGGPDEEEPAGDDEALELDE
jgi:hypothetical protein